MPERAPLPNLGTGPAVVAIDVGGTTMKVASVTPSGDLTAPRRGPSPQAGPTSAQEVVRRASELVREESERLGTIPAALGIALPGVVVEDQGLGVWSENLDWRDVDFRAAFAQALDLPVAIAHDVRAAGTAETRLGAARGAPTALVLAIGTGIATSVQVDGRVHVGRGYAGEVGHAVVVPGGEPCVCGNRGCLEATASAGAIRRRYVRDSGTPVAGAKEVLALADRGDPVALAVRESAFDALALGLSHAVTLLVPDTVVIAGGLSEAGDALLVPLAERLQQLVRYGPVPQLVRAELGEDAGLVGAALAARDSLAGESAQATADARTAAGSTPAP